jgi:hypothetical protein
MTLSLRRKRQTTAPSTPAATDCKVGEREQGLGARDGQFSPRVHTGTGSFTAFFSAMLLASGGFLACTLTQARAVEAASRPASSSSGKLHWLPYQAEKAKSDPEVRPVQYAMPVLNDALGAPRNAPTLAPRPAALGSEPPSATNEAPDERKPTLLPAPPIEQEKPLNELNKDNAAAPRECQSLKDLKPITKLNTDIDTVQGGVPKNCPWGNEEKFTGRSWESLTYTWTASALCHKPLYFEDVKLERYGHMWGPWLQPIISHARFFATVPLLPYEMGLETPNECMYALGYYRPGSCAPYYLDPIPLSVRAGLFEATAIVGGIVIFP